MKIVFNDLSELQVQSATPSSDGYLRIKTISATPDELRTVFSDTAKTRKMQVVDERGATLGTYEGYTEFYSTEEYTGGIYGVTNYKPAETPEAKEAVLVSSVKVAKIQAQGLTDEEALTVANLYPDWSGDGVAYAADYKVNYAGMESALYKCLQAHTSQPEWTPEAAQSLWAKVLNPDPSVIPEWEQPSSTNGYTAGDKVTHNGKTWESMVDNNVWEPGAPGSEALWREVTE